MTPTVTIVTARAASRDALTDADYRDIYDEIRQKASLRQFVDAIHSAVSFAWWSKYESGSAALNRERRNELRAAVGLPPLPPTVAEAVAAADPDATVYQVGAAPSDRLILIGADAHEPLALHINDNLTVLEHPERRASNGAPESHVTGVTSPRTRPPRKTIELSPERRDRLAALKNEAGLTWDEFADWVLQLCDA
jgi:hypothetical protein